MAFVGYIIAFDMLKHEYLLVLEVLTNQDISQNYVHLVKEIYSLLTIRLK